MAEIYQQWENILIQRGEERGEENALKRIALNLSADLNLTSEKIAEVLKLPLEKVR